jgi:acyl-CoA dehydrogenase
LDFDDTPEEAAFRREARSWLEAHAPARSREAVFAKSRSGDPGELERARAWQAAKAAGGFAGITLPVAYGGRGGSQMEAIIFGQEEARRATPRAFLEIGLELCIPIMAAFARPEDRARLIAPALRGEQIWCQAFSEPSSGSDVAGARLRALRDDDENWRLSGQKIWCSGAHYSDYAIVVTRSDPSKPKHAGLTFFWVDLRSPGVTVRPIRQASGQAEFNEIFFDNVRVPDTQRLGKVDGGWEVIVHTLMLERQAVGAGYADILGYREAIEWARRSSVAGRPALEDACVRSRLVDIYLQERGLQLANYAALTEISRGGTPGPEFSIGKLVGASLLQQTAIFAMEVLGPRAVTLADSDAAEARLKYAWFWGAAARIAGGSDEIVRNVLAERVLRLPPDVRSDKEVPFSEIPT